MITLANPWLLLLLPAPWLIWRFMPPHKEQVAAIRVPFFRMLTEAAEETPSVGATVLRRSKLQMGAAMAIWALIMLGLAQPERLGEPIVIEQSARDIVLALDISGSMDERDFVGEGGARQQRLAAVISVMKDFIAARDSDRMALIVFGSKAFVQAPFTEDLQSLDGFLDQTQVGMAGPNTAIGDAIGLAVRTFEASDVDERLIILLSDGADTSSRMTPINAATIAADRGVVIQTIGVGDPVASGEDKVDLGALENIAARTGGAFFFANDAEALGQIYAQIDEMTPRITKSTSYRPTENLSWIAAGAGLLIGLCTLSFLTIQARRRTT
ncbi:VWA domain-containing protein [Sedimentitalea todarodis]|uniref:VWA domain-containing protein n=1 Tax=Sedimentitalea todarodis TaxID=1631240 RepID=A0ABU3VGI3_9RHOB|nr:VWA domain-containing protein [Sedimentitalea todarodis]MDU9004784.1 VWA domain-containing protein [Sedimentitalea todarodis]